MSVYLGFHYTKGTFYRDSTIYIIFHTYFPWRPSSFTYKKTKTKLLCLRQQQTGRYSFRQIHITVTLDSRMVSINSYSDRLHLKSTQNTLLKQYEPKTPKRWKSYSHWIDEWTAMPNVVSLFVYFIEDDTHTATHKKYIAAHSGYFIIYLLSIVVYLPVRRVPTHRNPPVGLCRFCGLEVAAASHIFVPTCMCSLCVCVFT